MCLLIYHSSKTRFSKADIHDFYSYNPDGIGVMRIENGRVIVSKSLPRSVDEAYEFYLSHAVGHDCAIHFRMKTHGQIDEENCHPYAIPGTDCWLMHNGVLHTGNANDPTKSDTWHYARDYLQPLLADDPDVMFTSAFRTIIGEHIGNGNRFIIMSPRGHVIVNEHLGVEYKGAWMSNTYAWSAYVDVAVSVHGDSDDDVIECFFELLADASLWDAYSDLTTLDVRDAIYSVGLDAFQSFCEAIFDVPLDDERVKLCVKNPEEIFDVIGEAI